MDARYVACLLLACSSTQLASSRIKHHRAKRWEFTTYTVTESQPAPHMVAQLHSTYDDRTGNVRYAIAGQGVGSLFTVEPHTGKLWVNHQLDREAQSSYQLTVSAYDASGVAMEAPSEITIEVGDVNDNKPQFTSGKLFASVGENSPRGTLVTRVRATDADDPNLAYGKIVYSIVGGGWSDKFKIDRRNGSVTVASSSLDREQLDSYQLIVQARDSPGQELAYSSTTTLVIKITDVNDNPPVFVGLPFVAVVPENTEVGREVMRLNTSDADLRENRLSIFTILPSRDSHLFKIETIRNQGVLKVNQPLDYETAGEGKRYRVRVRARNVENSTTDQQLEALADVTIRVTDVDEPPEFSTDVFRLSVSEDAEPGDLVGKVQAADPEGDPFTFFMQTDDDDNTLQVDSWIADEKFKVDPRTGMISVSGKLDREVQDRYFLRIFAGVPGYAAKTSSAKVEIVIDDVNDNPPRPATNGSLELVLCDKADGLSQVAQPAIFMQDADGAGGGSPFHFYPVKNPHFERDFILVDNGDDSASLHTRHNYFRSGDDVTYRLPVLVADVGRVNATYWLSVRVCACTDEGEEICDALSSAGTNFSFLIVALCLLVVILVVVLAFIVARRRRQLAAAGSGELLKPGGSWDDVSEGLVRYDEEGGGEEDTAAFDLAQLHIRRRSEDEIHSTPSTKLSSLPPPYLSHMRRKQPRAGAGEDVADFILERKSEEDRDQLKLAFDSLQMYAYEGAGSDAGDLSSLCSGTDDDDDCYDYLHEWGPRFDTLATIYSPRDHFI